MQGASHLTIGITAGMWTAYFLPESVPLAARLSGAGLVALGSLAPDLDSRGMMSRALGPLGWILTRLMSQLSAALYAATKTSRDSDRDGSHRGFTHTFPGNLAFGLVIALGCVPLTSHWWLLGMCFALGCALHCIPGDWCTKAGVPWLWPLVIDGKRWYPLRSPAPFVTGSMTEHVVLSLLLLPAMALTAGATTGVLQGLVG